MAQEVTKLTPSEESKFQSWVKSNKITDVDAPSSFYDYRGYWKENGDKPIRFGVDHFTDIYKQHGHPTFSVESKYSNGPNDGGTWGGPVGETFIPPKRGMSDKQRIVNTPDGPQSFPPDATDAEISEALNAHPAASVPKTAKVRTWTDMAVDALPAAGGMIGGIVGGVGGTVAGVGVGGVPGAVVGATLGAGAGEAAKQLINRARGSESPSTPTDAALAIGKQGVIAGGTTAAGGLAVKGAQAAAPYAMKGVTAVADVVNPDLVGIFSPRIANAIRMAQKAVAVAKQAEPKLSLKAMDVVRIKSLMEQGISQGDALRTIAQMKMMGKL